MATPMEVMAGAVKAEFFRARFGHMDKAAALLESPLEEVIFWTLCAQFRDCYGREIDTLGFPGSAASTAWGVALTSSTTHWAEVCPQLKVSAGDREYRIDLALFVRHGYSTAAIAVELDGHEFHERTAEQAERDKRRDRELQAMGWKVVRFTGSQALRSPLEVVEEILGFAASVTKAVG